MTTPSRRRPEVPPLSRLDAPRGGGPEPWWARAQQEREMNEDVAGAQRAVAEERAAIARAVLAERAAAVRQAGPPRRRLSRAAAAGLGVLVLAALLLAARVWLVASGVLYGAVPVHALDAAAAGTVALGLVLTGWPHRLALALTVPAVAVAATTLAVPATPPSAPAAGCPAAPVRGTATVVTAFPVTTREGPGRRYEATGRFPAGCAVAVTGYCTGDPVEAGHGWLDSRWLLVERRSGGAAALVSRHLSGEPDRPRYLAAALAGPAAVPALPAADCGGVDAAGPAALGDLDPDAAGDNLVAVVPHAADIGFAAWVAPDPATGQPGLRHGDAYRQISAGRAGSGARRTTRWDYAALGRDLTGGSDRIVTVLAVGCAGPAAPADPGTAAVTTYRLGEKVSPPLTRLRGDEVSRDAGLRGLDLARLAAVACQPSF